MKMQSGFDIIVTVEHELCFGQHVVTSPDIPELSIARRSARHAYEDFNLLIRATFLTRAGRWAHIRPDVDAGAFARELEHDPTDAWGPPPIRHDYAIRLDGRSTARAKRVSLRSPWRSRDLRAFAGRRGQPAHRQRPEFEDRAFG